MVKVKYIGSLNDNSGYAEAGRNNVAALHMAGIDVATEAVSFEQFRSNLGPKGALVKELSKKEHTSPDVQIIHLTPQHFPVMKHKTAYNIGYATWETSLLPPGWAEMMNTMDEIWVPSQHNIDVFYKSGVNVDIRCFPHTFDMNEAGQTGESVVQAIADDEYMFYGIFQWLERKNPLGLLIAYLTEFSKDENVVLLLKTYLMTPGKESELETLRYALSEVKQKLWLGDYPRVLLVTSLLSSDQIASIHTRGDCLVSLNRCEGFGLPIAEAMLAGNPVITTNYGGPVDFINHEETGLLVGCNMTPTYGMPWNMYRGDMSWADPDIMEARKYMRWCFENKAAAEEIGGRAQRGLREKLSWQTVGSNMASRLKEIVSGNTR
jgi:glycosyltransferase involved in cell wall biosynthesis